MRLGFLDHAVDVVLAHAAVGLDRDLLLLARAEILRGDVHDAVRVNVEGNLDTRDAARRRRNVGKLEASERLVARSHLALALQDVDVNRRLVVRRRREDLTLPDRNRRVALDEFRRDAAQGLNAQGERRDVEEQHVLDLADDDARLDRRADGDALVRVHAVVRLLAEVALDGFLHGRNARGSANEKNLVDVRRRKTRIRHRLARRTHRALDEVMRELVELGARELQVEMLRA